MYKVLNITRGKVILGDLGIVFCHGEEKDLDETFPRHQIEGSQNLKAAIHYGKLSKPIKDEPLKPEQPQTTTFFMPPTPGEVTQNDLAALEKRIKDHLSAQVKSQNPNATVPSNVQQKLDAIIDILAKGIPAQSVTNVESGEIVSAEDDDKLIDIQVKALQRLTRNAEGQIAAKEENKNSDIGDRASELENLL